MYCEVELIGAPIPDRIVIPRSAVHDGALYTLNPQNRLVRKNVTVDFAQGDFYAIAEGLQAEDRLVVSDLIPAVEGMKVDPHEDAVLSERLYDEASGKTEPPAGPPENR